MARNQRLSSSKYKTGNPKPKRNPRAKENLKIIKNAPNYDSDELSVRKLDKRMVSRYISLNFALSYEELQAKLKTPISVFERGIISIMMKTADMADQYRMDFLLDRLIGKVKNEIDLTTNSKFDTMTDEQLIEEKQRLDEINRVRLKHLEEEQGIIDVTPQVERE